jgi:hypothetical protein
MGGGGATRRIRQEFTCDQPGCRRGYFCEGTHAQAQRYAQAIGWNLRRHPTGKDYCPNHRSRRDRIRTRREVTG